ncbi:MAG: DUF2288 family protein [Methylococcaceae bacterium]|nr:DUF2288 family protein [Methylococcaceae bacterium]
MTSIDPSITREKINLETSKMPWSELQRFFASGMAVFVTADLDLVEVAFQFSQDNKVAVETWMNAHKIGVVSDEQAQDWSEKEAVLWAVVVKPWILVQDKE